MQRLTFSFQGVEFPAILLDKGEWIFSANVVCIECELVTNQNHISRYLQRAVPAQYYFEFNPQDGGRPGYYLKLPGMFHLLLLANTEKGEDFKYWVCDKVLPSLFENNRYVDEKNITINQLIEHKQEIDNLLNKCNALEKDNERLIDLDYQKTQYIDNELKIVKQQAKVDAKFEVEAEYIDSNGQKKTISLAEIEYLKKQSQKADNLDKRLVQIAHIVFNEPNNIQIVKLLKQMLL